MAQNHEILSSCEAFQGFKNKIGDSLSLLQFLNEEDKTNCWKFWKTISSAVKIALNGKGDVATVSKRSNDLEWQKNETDLRHVQILEKNAKPVHLPPNSTNVDPGNYRVLKVINDSTHANYDIAVPISKELSRYKGTTEEQDFLDNINKTFNTDLTQDDILPPVTATAVNTLNTTAAFIVSTGHESVQYQCSSIETSKDQSQRKKKPVIWPVGRPSTRSMSKNPGSCNSNILTKQNTTPEAEPDLKNKKADQEGYGESDLRVSGCDIMKIVNSSGNDSIKILPHSHKEHNQNDNSNLDVSSRHELVNCEILPTNNELHSHRDQESYMPNSTTSSGNLPITSIQTVDAAISNSSIATQLLQIKIEEPGIDNNSHMGLEIKPRDSGMDQVNGQGHLMNKSTSDIETIISALEAELKKTGSDEGSISIPSGKEGRAEVVTGSSHQVVQLIPGQEIVEIHSTADVIWTSCGSAQISVPPAVIEAAAVEGNVLEEGGVVPHIDAQYDVVEYEVFADKEKSGTAGRKKKNKGICQEKDMLDRTCPMCHRVLTYASSMAAHMRIHTGDRPYSCGQCDRKFTTKANRDRHEATHVGLKPFKCTECDKSFTEKRSLKIHMRSHTGERPFVCTICGRGFAQKCTLLVHMDRHTDKKGHLCDLCGKAFRQKCQLDIHVKRHNRQANYPCAQCSVKCYTRGDLMRHMIKHTGERPFQCHLCSRTFTRKQYLMDHENTHYGRKPYKCSICSQAFHDMGSCHRHLRKHRQEEEEEISVDKSKKMTSLLSTEDFNLILKGSQTGQVLTLEDGTKALIKAVESEADGSIVYHISCVDNNFGPNGNSNTEMESSVPPSDDKPALSSSEMQSNSGQ